MFSSSFHHKLPQNSLSFSSMQDGMTPLILAATMGHTDIVQYLTKHGTSIHMQEKVNKNMHVSGSCGIHVYFSWCLHTCHSEINISAAGVLYMKPSNTWYMLP